MALWRRDLAGQLLETPEGPSISGPAPSCAADASLARREEAPTTPTVTKVMQIWGNQRDRYATKLQADRGIEIPREVRDCTAREKILVQLQQRVQVTSAEMEAARGNFIEPGKVYTPGLNTVSDVRNSLHKIRASTTSRLECAVFPAKPAKFLHVPSVESFLRAPLDDGAWIARMIGFAVIDDAWLKCALKHNKWPQPAIVFNGLRSNMEVIVSDKFKDEHLEVWSALGAALSITSRSRWKVLKDSFSPDPGLKVKLLGATEMKDLLKKKSEGAKKGEKINERRALALPPKSNRRLWGTFELLSEIEKPAPVGALLS